MRINIFLILLFALLCAGCNGDETQVVNNQETITIEGQIVVSPTLKQMEATTRSSLNEVLNYDYEVLYYNYVLSESSVISLGIIDGESGDYLPFKLSETESLLDLQSDGTLTSRDQLLSGDVILAAGSRVVAIGAAERSIAMSLGADMPSSFANVGDNPLSGGDFVDNLYIQGELLLAEATTLEQLSESDFTLSIIPSLIAIRVTNDTIDRGSIAVRSAKLTASEAIFSPHIELDGGSYSLTETGLYDELIATTSSAQSVAPGEFTTLYMYALPTSNEDTDITIEVEFDVVANDNSVNLDTAVNGDFQTTTTTTTITTDYEDVSFALGEGSVFETNIEDDAKISLSIDDEQMRLLISAGSKFTFDINCVNRAWSIETPEWLTLTPSWCSEPCYEPVTITATFSSSESSSESEAISFVDYQTQESMHSISVVKSPLYSELMAILSDLNSGMTTPVTLNWSASLPIADWEGVTLNSDGDDVVKLELSGRGFQGVLPTTNIYKLTEIEHLDLSDNGLTGEVLVGYGNILLSLTYLDLSRNKLTKVNLQSFGGGELKYLYLNDNEISTTTGNVDTVTSLPNLVDIDLSNNLLSSSLTLQSGVAGPANLRLFSIKNNSLKGTLPEYLSSSTKLETLRTSGNASLGGELPASLIEQLGYSAAEVEAEITSTTLITIVD